ncbi:MAG: hypothetical protein NTZ33_04195 [Bacteroidetes bacterium]|nr:hypothetical protein [Bacteroidota bacterium]
MKKYRVVKVSCMWTNEKLSRKVENILNEYVKDGFEIVKISFSHNIWRREVAYLTFCR